MPSQFEYLHSDVYTILIKERELIGSGYLLKYDTRDENILEPGEYLIKSPHHKNPLEPQGWDYMSLIWHPY